MNLEEKEDKYIINLDNEKVSECYTDFALILKIKLDENNFTIRIGNEMFYHQQNQALTKVFHEHLPDGFLSTLQSLSVKDILIFRTGALIINFTDNSSIEIFSDKKYEAWEIFDDKGMKFVSIPGGEIAFWKPTN